MLTSHESLLHVCVHMHHRASKATRSLKYSRSSTTVAQSKCLCSSFHPLLSAMLQASRTDTILIAPLHSVRNITDDTVLNELLN